VLIRGSIIIAVCRAAVEARIVGRARPDGRSGRPADEHPRMP
jgi:hypothetical protein